MKDTLVKEIMSTELLTLSPYDTLATAKNVFEENGIHHIPVMDEGGLVGILSNTDLERCKQGKTLFVHQNVDRHNETIFEVTYISTVMTEVVETVTSQDSIYDVYRIFKQNRFRSLPVFEHGHLVGIVTPMDFLDFFFNKKNNNG